MSDDRWIGVGAAARRLSVHRNTIRYYIAAGKLRSVKRAVRGWARVSQADVEKMHQHRAENATSRGFKPDVPAAF